MVAPIAHEHSSQIRIVGQSMDHLLQRHRCALVTSLVQQVDEPCPLQGLHELSGKHFEGHGMRKQCFGLFTKLETFVNGFVILAWKLLL